MNWTENFKYKTFKISTFLDLVASLCLVYAVSAAPTNEKENVQAAQFGMGPYNPYYAQHSFYNYMPNQMYHHNPMEMGSDLQSFGPLNPDKYLKMEDDEFPVDYSLPCSNSCGCRQVRIIFKTITKNWISKLSKNL